MKVAEVVNILSEELHNEEEIRKITETIFNGIVIHHAQERKGINASYNVGRYFSNGRNEPNIQLKIKWGNRRGASAIADDLSGRMEIELVLWDNAKDSSIGFLTRAYKEPLQHEVIHILDFIRSKGKHHVNDYKKIDWEDEDFIVYYNHELEFNQAVNHICMAAKSDLKFFKHVAKMKYKLLSYVKEVEPNFYRALYVNKKLYNKFLSRLVREKMIDASPNA